MPSSTAVADPLLTPADVAERLATSTDTVYGWLNRGELIGVDISRTRRRRARWRVRQTDLEKFLAARSAGPLPKAPRRRRGHETIVNFV